jgi:hypothetical protein
VSLELDAAANWLSSIYDGARKDIAVWCSHGVRHDIRLEFAALELTWVSLHNLSRSVISKRVVFFESAAIRAHLADGGVSSMQSEGRFMTNKGRK